MCGFLKGQPDSIQIIEFYGNDPVEIEQRAMEMHADLQRQGYGYAHDYYPEGKVYHDVWGCLLYTSDAADERSSVDLGGRRIIKKKT